MLQHFYGGGGGHYIITDKGLFGQWEGLEMRPDIYGCLLQADGGSGDVFCQQTDYLRQRELIDSNMFVVHLPRLCAAINGESTNTNMWVVSQVWLLFGHSQQQ